MALTVSRNYQRESVGLDQFRVNIVDITFDSSYPTGGESLTPAQCGMDSEILAVLPELGDTGYAVRYDRANEKLMAYMGDNNNASDGPLIEVADTTDLSTLDVRIVVIGR